MKIKELREMIKDYNDEKDVVFLSTSGMEWKLNKKVKNNPSDKGKDKQVVIYIT